MSIGISGISIVILDFGTTFTALLEAEGIKGNEFNQIKFWFKVVLANPDDLPKYDPSCGVETDSVLLFNIQRWTASLEF